MKSFRKFQVVATAAIIATGIAACGGGGAKTAETAQASVSSPTDDISVKVAVDQNATLEEIVIGPATENDGTLNLMGALRTSMATCGYESIHDFQKAEVMLAPAIKTEGKSLQQAQRIGMG